MAYLALYRKYRPSGFGDVIGQEHITKTLCNQIEKNRISHAYLFTGTRGVGKTTIARIFARAINCENPKHGNPCGECEVCRELARGNSMDIIEMDGASNNGVDQVRDIRDNVVYPPVSGKYKVYIIDEVHMLTMSAFNALLKTLEEPPEHVVFILCTTESHKIPQTILSRCMRFDFRLVSTAAISEYLKYVLDKEKKEAEESAVYLIAENAQGSVRDALSLCDRCMNSSNGTLTYNDTVAALGTGDLRSLREFVGYIADGDVGETMKCAEILLKSGRNPSVLARELAGYFRNMLLVKETKGANEVLKLPQDIFEFIEEDALSVKREKLLYSAEVFGKLEGELRYSSIAGVIFEVAAVRAAMSADKTIEARLEALEKGMASGGSFKVSKDLSGNTLKLYWASVIKKVRNVDPVLSAAMDDIIRVEMVEGVVYLYTTELTKGIMEKDDALSNAFGIEFGKVFGEVRYRFVAIKAENDEEKLRKLKEITDNKLDIE